MPSCGKRNPHVLILVLVEHTLGDGVMNLFVAKDEVLILVLVEHTLGDIRNVVTNTTKES